VGAVDVIVVDAAGVPDFASGARTRLRGLVAALARRADTPALTIVIARGSTLLDGIALGPIAVAEVAEAGGPWRRFASPARAPWRQLPPSLAAAATLWHGETIPTRAPPGVPKLLTLHDLRWAEPRAATGASLARWLPRHLAALRWLPRSARRLAALVTVSEASATRAAELLRLPRERIEVVANATWLEPVVRGEEEARRLLVKQGVEGRPFFVALGHLEPRKALAFALDALAAARGAAASARLVVVGEGPQRGELERHARRLHLAERVRFAGRLPDDATATLLRHAAALLFPTRYEGFGFPLYESFALGCPVVAHRLPPFAELPTIDAASANHATHAALVAPGDSAQAWGAELDALVATAHPIATRRRLALATPWRWDDAATALLGAWRKHAGGSRSAPT